jgi:FkbM family methyltransferase
VRSQRVRLPSGVEIQSARREEALLMYGEVGEYVRHGLTLRPGDTIFDVGANIGIFSLWAHDRCAGDIRAYAFEPIPATFALLEANFAQVDRARLRAFNVGLAARRGELRFAYYPNATFASTAYPDPADAELRLTETLLGRSLHQLPPALSFVPRLPPAARRPLIRLLSRYINQRRYVTCQLQTLSEVIRAQGVERIDFLKIDAEKSELDVLLGIADADWGKVRQVFVEAHDRAGRAATICELLRGRGFQTVIQEQDPFFAGTEIHAIYAAR